MAKGMMKEMRRDLAVLLNWARNGFPGAKKVHERRNELPDIPKSKGNKAPQPRSALPATSRPAKEDTPSPREIEDADRGPIHCSSIVLDLELSELLQSAVLEHRKAKTAEDRVDSQLDELDQLMGDTNQDINDLAALIADAETSDQEQSLRQEAEKVRKRQEDLEIQRSKIHAEMDEMYARFRHHHYELFDRLDDVLVRSALLSHVAGDDETIAEATRPVTTGEGRPASAMDEGETVSAAKEARVPSNPSDVALHRKPGIADLKRTDSIKDALAAAQEGADQTTKAELLYNFRMKRTALDQAEHDLDCRHEAFDEEADERDRGLHNGEAIETCTEFEMRIFHQTRHLTRRVIEAEAGYEEAKAAVTAAGFQLPGSDIESGFAEDPDDGYRMSMEQEMCHSVDAVRLQAWLERMPDDLDPSKEIVETVPEAQLDGWDAKSVQIEDSASMLAEGRTRKRIDKWRAICAMAKPAVAVE